MHFSRLRGSLCALRCIENLSMHFSKFARFVINQCPAKAYADYGSLNADFTATIVFNLKIKVQVQSVLCYFILLFDVFA